MNTLAHAGGDGSARIPFVAPPILRVAVLLLAIVGALILLATYVRLLNEHMLRGERLRETWRTQPAALSEVRPDATPARPSHLRAQRTARPNQTASR